MQALAIYNSELDDTVFCIIVPNTTKKEVIESIFKICPLSKGKVISTENINSTELCIIVEFEDLEIIPGMLEFFNPREKNVPIV